MDADEFRKAGKEMVDFVADYLENIRERPVLSDVQPGYIRELLPPGPPEHGGQWQDIMKDLENVILKGMTHWHSPHFHAYFPTANSYPAICADILSGALACIGFTWAASPACTELEMVMMDWLADMLGLPKEFTFNGSNGKGGGVIQVSASDATLVALMAARSKTLNACKDATGDSSKDQSKLVCYFNSEAHSSVPRAALMGMAIMHQITPTDDSFAMRGEPLRKAIQEDKRKGLIPFYVVATLGTTNSCAFDNLEEIGKVCSEEGLWLHVDAAYAGSAFICPEYRYLFNGIEHVDSFSMNPHKWLLVNFDCSAMWVRNSNDLVQSFNVNPVYLQHENQDVIPDYRHWQIPLGRRFRSLKMWFVFRMYGVEGLRKYIRKHISLAKEFEELVRKDDRFTIISKPMMGLVCFRLKGSDSWNESLLKTVNDRRRIHITPTRLNDEYVIRFAVCAKNTESSDVIYAWDEITKVAAILARGPTEEE